MSSPDRSANEFKGFTVLNLICRVLSTIVVLNGNLPNLNCRGFSLSREFHSGSGFTNGEFHSGDAILDFNFRLDCIAIGISEFQSGQIGSGRKLVFSLVSGSIKISNLNFLAVLAGVGSLVAFQGVHI